MWWILASFVPPILISVCWSYVEVQATIKKRLKDGRVECLKAILAMLEAIHLFDLAANDQAATAVYPA
jgi:hypothetical protein